MCHHRSFSLIVKLQPFFSKELSQQDLPDTNKPEETYYTQRYYQHRPSLWYIRQCGIHREVGGQWDGGLSLEVWTRLKALLAILYWPLTSAPWLPVLNPNSELAWDWMKTFKFVEVNVMVGAGNGQTRKCIKRISQGEENRKLSMPSHAISGSDTKATFCQARESQGLLCFGFTVTSMIM